MPEKPKLILELDSSQIKTFLKCPMQWHYEYVASITKRTEDSKKAMNAGTYGHTRLQKYYELRAENDPNANTASISLPETTEEKTMLPDKEDRLNVIVGVISHNGKYRNNDVVPFSKESVEVGFSVPFYEDAFVKYVICGRIDVVGTLQGMNVFMDHKFQFRKSYIFERDIQFKTYAFALNKSLGPIVGPFYTAVVNYIRLTKSVDETAIERRLISFLPDEIDRWGVRLIEIFDRVARFLQNDFSPESIWENDSIHNWGMCGDQKYGDGTCEFAQLCNAPNFQVSQDRLKLYHIKPVWRPWDVQETKKEREETTNETQAQ